MSNEALLYRNKYIVLKYKRKFIETSIEVVNKLCSLILQIVFIFLIEILYTNFNLILRFLQNVLYSPYSFFYLDLLTESELIFLDGILIKVFLLQLFNFELSIS